MLVNQRRQQAVTRILKQIASRILRRLLTCIETARARRWNPRYLAYCRVHRKTPRQMDRYDRARFPGGVMCGYLIWIEGCWAAWRLIHGVPDIPLNADGHAQFDRWLSRETRC